MLRIKTSKIINDMAKVSIKSEKITPYGGIFHVREQFPRFVGPVIDKVLGLRCTSFGYQYSEILGPLSSIISYDVLLWTLSHVINSFITRDKLFYRT